jgi:hypothetical protein
MERYRAGDFRIEGNKVLASFPSAFDGKYDFRRGKFSSLQFQSIARNGRNIAGVSI